MAILDNELTDQSITPESTIASPTQKVADPFVAESFGGFDNSKNGLTIDQMSHVQAPNKVGQWDGPQQMVPRSELMENSRYSVYQRGVDLENIYGLQQNGFAQLGNGVAKFGATMVGTFAQSLTNIPNVISSLKNGPKDLSGNPDGYEGSIDNWLKNLEDVFPNYYTRQEREHPYLAMIPFATGNANFWGDKVIKNLGFTAGAIAGAAAQDLALGMVTEGLGSIPLLANQIGKASLWLNKILSGTNDLEKVLATGKIVGATELLAAKNLAQLAAATKVANGFKYAAGVFGSAQTEAGVEARDGYRQVKQQLIKQYKLDNTGVEPTGEDAAEIEKYATDAMNTRFGINMALLTVSNAIQFDSLFKSFGNAGKPLTSSLTKDIEEAGKIGLKEGSLDVFEKKGATAISGKIWESVKPTLSNVLTEGVYEEGGQYAAERGTYDYYTRKYKDPKRKENEDNWNNLNEILESTGKGLADQFGTSEGIENMLVGGLTAIITGGLMGRIDRARGGQSKDQRLQSSINMLNNYGLTGILSNKYDNTLNSIGIAKDMDKAAKSGDIFAYKNLQNNMFFNFVQSRIPAGMHDVTIEQLNMLKDLSKEDFEKTFGMDFNTSNKDTVSDYVDGLIKEANSIKVTTDAIQNTFKNPFTRSIDPKTDEEKIQGDNYNIFENWKTDLVRYASVTPNVNNRLNSIQDSVSDINPLVSNDLLSKITDQTSLRELSASYEEEANQLNQTITEYTSPSDKRATTAKIKALRNQSEKINLALANKAFNLQGFNDLLNFELNGQDATKDKVVGLESSTELHNLGGDINKLIKLKKTAADIFDSLATEKGFDKYFKQAEQMASEAPVEAVEPTVESPFEFTNKTGDKEGVQVNREYQLPTEKKAKVEKLADDRFEVTAPNGNKTFFKTQEKADAEAEDINQETQDRSKVKVLATNADGTVKVEDAAGNIQNISLDDLAGYEKIQSEQEKLQRVSEDVDKEQTDIENKSGEVATPDTTVELVLHEGRLKDATILFPSTTSAEEGPDFIPKPHEARPIEFLNNVKNFKNASKIRAILVTPNQEVALGLDGLSAVAFDVSEEEANTDAFKAKVRDLNDGLVAAVYVEQDGQDVYFVDKEGNRIGKVGDKGIDLQKVVFNSMPSTKLTNKYGDRYRKEQKQEAEQQQAAWKIKRAELFKDPSYTVYNFTVSSGIPIENKSDRNPVGDNLVPTDKISTEENLIQISTTGMLSYKGRLIKVPVGRPILQYGDVLQPLVGRTFSIKQSQGIFEVIKALSAEIKSQADAGKPVRINRLYSTYLQNILYWKSGGENVGDNQIYIDTKGMNLVLGGVKYDLTDIANNEKKMIDQLKNIYQNINKNTLTNSFHETFLEPHMFEGKLVVSEWRNYQTYLLSTQNPDGSARGSRDVPLTTTVIKPTPQVPYNFIQKYATLEGLELPVQELPKEEAKPTPPPSSGPSKVAGFVLDGVTENTYELTNGPALFTASTDDAGNVSIEVGINDTVTKIASNDATMTQIIAALKANNEFDALKTNEQLVTQFIANRIAADIQATVVANTVVETTPVISDIEAKKADIEKRRQEELDKVRYRDRTTTDSIVTGEKTFEKEARRVNSVRREVYNLPELTTEELKNNIVAVIKNGNKYNEINIDEINAKYDAELAALEEPTGFDKTGAPDNSEFRAVAPGEVGNMTDAEIALFKQWHANTATNMPYEVLEQMVTMHNGEQAFGVYENGVVKFYKGALKGTEYHEAFHGIFKGFLSLDAQQALYDEFKTRAGEFKDRESGKTIKYEDATDRQIRDKMADEFADFKAGKIKAKTLGEKLVALFRNIINFVKSFGSKPSLKEQLFKAIETGKFKNAEYAPHKTNEAAEYRAIGGLSEKQTNEFVQDITARVFRIIFGTNKNLFNPEELTAPEILDRVKAEYEKEGKLELLGDDRFNQLVTKSKNLLRTFRINFNEDEVGVINDNESNNRNYSPEPFSVDYKKSASYVIKLLLGTLTESEATSQENPTMISLPRQALSSVNGLKLLNYSRAFATVIDKLANTTKVTGVVDKLVNLAKSDANYVKLFTRLGGDRTTGEIDFSKLEAHDWRLFVNFFQTFTKQKPNALVQYINAEGEVYTAPANLLTAIKQTQQDWTNNMIASVKDPNSLIKVNKTNETYYVSNLSGVSVEEPKDMVDFLNKLGVTFSIDDYIRLKNEQKKKFENTVGDLYTYLQKTKEIASITGQTLGVSGPLTTLAGLLVQSTNPIQDSTFPNVEGEKTQAYSDNNAISFFENNFNEADTLDELLQARPELKDIFSTSSIVLKKGGLFFDASGRRYKTMKVGYIGGTSDASKESGVSTANLTLGDRFTQEINQNLNGEYYVLIPADSSTEWMINMGNNIKFAEVDANLAYNKIYTIFKGYLEDEFALALDNRSELNNTAPRAKELRFLQDILSPSLLSQANTLITNNATKQEIAKFIKDNEKGINESVKAYIDGNVQDTRKTLEQTRKIKQVREGVFTYEDLDSNFAKSAELNKKELSNDDVNNILTFANANYIINNIEMHKVLFGDPYQFKIEDGKLDETKRIKSFLSPRRTTFDSPEFNTAHNQKYNTAGDVVLETTDLGYHLFKPFTNTITLRDVTIMGDLLGKTNEADAASWIQDNTYREVKLKNGQWSDEAEDWHQWQMAYTRNALAGKGVYTYTNKALQKQDLAKLKEDEPEFVTEVMKPIVSGNKYGKSSFDLVLDKFSQMPVYYKMVEGKTLENLYVKMWKEDIGYAVFESGRKVGAEQLHDLYIDGKFNDAPFPTPIQVAWSSYGIQVENSYEGDKFQTRGSQLTKLASLDLFENGVASSPEAQVAYDHYNDVLGAYHLEKYNNLLNSLGITDLGDSFSPPDNPTVAQTLELEMLKRELSDNVLDTIQLNADGKFRIPFEASPAYVQIKNILYSMVNKAIISPSMNGKAHVQVPVTGWEDAGKGRRVVEINGKKVLTDDTLKFYTREERWCEVLLPHWFKEKFAQAGFKSDEELLTYLNKKENQSILRGIGFRIPTQSMSSIELFKVKGFLDKSMGSTIVVPSEITTKAGSDFDIDKLNTYLKNVYVSGPKQLKEVPYFGKGEEAKQAIKDFIKKEKLDISVNKLYLQSLENEYYNSIQAMISLPENFDRLITPVGDAGLKNISVELDKLMGIDDTKDLSTKMVNRNYLTTLRNAFITAKKWVGIAAVNITNHSLSQKVQLFIDPKRIANLSKYEKRFLGDGKIKLDHNKVKVDGQDMISLSGVKTADDKEYISDNLSGYATAFVDVAKDPYILKIINNNLVVGTFMFLQRAGVPTKQAALFMNQPIIKEYLKNLDSINSKSIFNKNNIKAILAKFPTDNKSLQYADVKIGNFKNNIKQYYTAKLTPGQNAEQQKVLMEFLKYQTMAGYLFKLSQATNYDTTKIKSGDAFAKKQSRTIKADESNIFSSASSILEKSHIGEQANLLDRIMEGMGEILKLERPEFTIITNKALSVYSNNEYLAADKFDTIAAKVKTGLLDYIIQTKTGLNAELKSLLVDPETSIDGQLAEAKRAHPEMAILNSLTTVNSGRKGGATTVKLKVNIKDAYDENLYTGMMRELRDNPDTRNFYYDLVTMSILQGTYQTANTIKNVIPIEDYSAMLSDVISTLRADKTLDAFADGIFERNNWQDENIVKTVKNLNIEPINQYIDKQGNEVVEFDVDEFPTLEGLANSTERKVLALSIYDHYMDIGNDVIKVPRVISVGKARYDLVTGKSVSKKDYAERKAKGDKSLSDFIGYQKVKYGDNQPLIKTYATGPSHIYKMINLLGDGQFATEYYNTTGESVFNNGTVHIDKELSDGDIIRNLRPDITLDTEGNVLSSQPEAPIRIISDADVAAFNLYLKKADGKYPKEFFTSSTKFKEFYNKESGRREGAPQDSIWVLKANNLYDLVSKDGGEVYISNVDLTTGKKSIQPEGLPPIKDNNKNNCG
jgi:hypothetical protein